MTPIERAARALYITQNVNPAFLDDPEEVADIDKVWRGYVPEVRAILAAIRKPSDAMQDAGALAGDWNRDNLDLREEAEKVFTAMIDALLLDI